MVALKAENLLTCLYVPQLRRVVHRARGHEHAVRVEREAHNFHFVALERVVALAGVRVPDLRLPVEGAGHDFVSARNHGMHSERDCSRSCGVGTYP